MEKYGALLILLIGFILLWLGRYTAETDLEKVATIVIFNTYMAAFLVVCILEK